MKICIINGSPKGQYSITLQTCLYLEKQFPNHEFQILHVGQRIKQYEKDMSEAISTLKDSDLFLFSYPVYTFLVPSQLHRFIELMKASGEDFSKKYATQISTSKHFYDVTAHRFIEDNLHDMGIHVIHGLSADMEDLLKDAGQKDAVSFMKYIIHCVENQISEPCVPVINSKDDEDASQSIIHQELSTFSVDLQNKTSTYEVVIVTDLHPDETALKAKIDEFQSTFPYKSRVVNISEYPLKGGCLGCFHCAASGKCIYTDGFDSFLREQIQTASAIVYAFRIKDHSMGSRFKMYDDRQFCNGHRTVTEGMPFGYIIQGDYQAEPNLQTVVEARCEVGHNFLAGVGTDTVSIKSMCERLVYAIENNYLQPKNFYGVGGMKIFRDLIWIMRGMMKADHQFYKKHGVYDFPQKEKSTIIKMKLVGALIRNPKVYNKMGNKMNEGMIAPYKKIIDNK